MRRMKFKYYVDIAYLDTNTDHIKLEYIETLSYNGNDAKYEAEQYISRFPNVSHVTILEVHRE